MAIERGMGVAVMTSVWGLRSAFADRAARCSTPKRCCSSTTTSPRSRKVTGSLRRACVPMTMPASPVTMSFSTPRLAAAERLPVSSTTPVASGWAPS